MEEQESVSLLTPPTPISTQPATEIDLKAGGSLEQNQCRICLETDGALLLFVLVGLSGCFLTCFDSRVRGDLAQPCGLLTECCLNCGSCLPVAGEGAPLLIIGTVIALVIFAFFGLICSILVATMAGQRIWQRHYHILAKKMLTKVS